MFKILTGCLDKSKKFSEAEINSVSPYLFCRWLSGNQYTIFASNELNKYYNEIPFLNQYQMIRETFGNKIKFIPFPKSLKDEDFRRFWSLKNITPKWLKDAQHQKKEIKKSELDKYGLWDILPIGNFSKYLKY